MTIKTASKLNNITYYNNIIKEKKWSTTDEWIMFNRMNRLCREECDKGLYECKFDMTEYSEFYKYEDVFVKFGYHITINRPDRTITIGWG
jgi:hypothetical protein